MDLAELNKIIGEVRELAETLRVVRGLIENKRPLYDGNETNTKHGLINPVLERLGWDVSNQELVWGEHPMGGGKVDYALIVANKPIAVIEAKKLGNRLRADVTAQVLNYISDHKTVRYAIATNGNNWRMQIRGERKPAVDLILTEGQEHETALELMKISRSVLQPADRIGEDGGNRGIRGTESGPASDGWHDLSDHAFVPTHKRAIAIRLRGKVIKTRNFTEAAVKIANWLATDGVLTRDHCPIKLHPTGVKYFIALEPIHEDGKEFRTPKELQNGMVMETNASLRTLLTCVRDLADLGASSENISIKWVERAKKP